MGKKKSSEMIQILLRKESPLLNYETNCENERRGLENNGKFGDKLAEN